MLKSTPAVFAVGKEYQILAKTTRNAFFSVKVGDRTYFDAASGVVRSMTTLHRVRIPMEHLNEAGGYTVCIRPLVERKPYFTETKPTEERFFPFRPVPETNIRAYHIADAHNRIEQPLKAAKAFGPIDLLILNGDLIDYCNSVRNFNNIYTLCASLTGGQIPVIFSRGNHDMRGPIAERFLDHIPHQHGNTYHSFRLGSIWGVILDCGEDKPDEHSAYGGTVACHDFRLQQTDFLKELIANAQTEYAADGVKTRLVISHGPFTEKNIPPFDIEEPVYRQWCALLREHIKPHLMLCGHTHAAEIRYPGHVRDTYGQPCPVVIASGFDNESYWTGCGFVFGDGGALATYTDSEGNVQTSQYISYNT